MAGSYVEVTYCVDCGEELSREEKTIAPLEHAPSDWLVDVTPTCASVGVKYIACTVCEKRLQVDQIPATEQHRPSEARRENVKDAACDVLGSYVEVITCLDCSQELSRAQKEIPMLPHTPSDWIVDTDSTCSKVGVKHKECTVCDAMLETGEVYFKAHTPSDTVIENSVDASCRKEGSYDEVVYCTECKEELARTKKTVSKKPHTPFFVDRVEPTYRENGYTEGFRCSVCYAGLEGFQTIPALLQGTDIHSDRFEVTNGTLRTSVSHAEGTFYFSSDLIVAAGASYEIALDKDFTQILQNKRVENLKHGDNTVFLRVTKGEESRVYTVIIRRLPLYRVTFYSAGEEFLFEMIEEGQLAVEPAIERAGYTFVSWNYDFTKPVMNNLSLTASWKVHTDTRYTVEYYLQNVNNASYTLFGEATESKTGTTDTRVSVSVKEIPHFTFEAEKSVTSGVVCGDGSLVLKLYYTRNAYRVSAQVNNNKAGKITAVQNYFQYGTKLTYTATTNEGYTFLGWYEGKTRVCKTEAFTFELDHTVTYTATWAANKDTPYKVEYYVQTSSRDGYSLVKTEQSSATTDTEVTWTPDGVLDDCILNPFDSVLTGLVTGDGTLTLRVYYLRRSELYRIKGELIYFGEYPQSLKSDEVTVLNVRDARGYFLGSDGYYYAKVVATPDWKVSFSTEETIVEGETYYFKVERIRWRVLKSDGNTAILVCDSIIDTQIYDDGVNNYKESYIRQWLNREFYNTAFGDLQKEIILTSTVDNGDMQNPFDCEDTEDNVYLLSEEEAYDKAYFETHLDRQRKTSDYARARGAFTTYIESISGDGNWWLRSPNGYSEYHAQCIDIGGRVDYKGVSSLGFGVVPALKIKL